MRHLLVKSAVVFSLLTLSSCESAKTDQPSRFRLYVSLFSSIPDAAEDSFSTLKTHIKQDFESKNPSIELLIKDLDTVHDDAYTVSKENSNQIGTWLTAPVAGDDPNKSGLHLVEADMVVLDELVRQGLIKPWEMPGPTADWHPAAKEAVTLDGKIYGIPHWLCADFIFAHKRDIVKSNNATELRAALDKGTTPAHLAGRMVGSWNFASLYLQAFADTHGADHVVEGLAEKLDDPVVDGLNLVAQACAANGKNPCLDSTYKVTTSAPYLLAEDKADALIGYSERLHYILKHSTSKESVYFESAPLGKGNHPVLFVDAFVLRKDCVGACESSAGAFAQYMADPGTMSWILTSQDASSNRVPRYLLAATDSAYRADGVKTDQHYNQMKEMVRDGRPYPNKGFYGVREKLLKQLEARIK
jgi:thiamine pyridinylase